MKARRLVLLLMAVFALSGAMLSAVSAAPRSQEATQEAREQARPERPAKAFLGLETTKLSAKVTQYLEASEGTSGLLVMGTIPGSPADASGLQRGDIVLSIDGLVLEAPHSLQRLVNSKAPGDVLEVAYLRDGVQATVSITLADFADHRPVPQPQWLAQLRNFLRTFPNVVVGNLDVLGDDDLVHVHTITPSQIVTVEGAAVTVVDRLGETSTYTVGDSTAIVRGDSRIALANLREGTHVVVLEIDGALKAIVVSAAPTIDAGRVRGSDIGEIQPNRKGPIVSTFRTFMNDLREQFRSELERDAVQEKITKLQERIAELLEQTGNSGDGNEEPSA